MAAPQKHKKLATQSFMRIIKGERKLASTIIKQLNHSRTRGKIRALRSFISTRIALYKKLLPFRRQKKLELRYLIQELSLRHHLISFM